MNKGRCADCKNNDHCGQCECCDVPSLTDLDRGTVVSVHYVRDDFPGRGDLTGEFLGYNFRCKDITIRTPRGFRDIIPLRWITDWAVA